jgi:signal transduction histidine kinase
MRRPSTAVGDLLVAAVLVAVTQVEVWAMHDRIEGSLPWQHVAFLLMTGAVAVRRTAPLVATLVCSAGLGLQTALGDAPVVGGFVALLVVLVSLGHYASLRIGLVGLAVMLLSVLSYDLVADTLVIADLVGNTMIAVLAWGAGRVLRTSIDRRVEAELSRDRFAREAVAAERGRIARDLHDSVAHALTVMTLQAGAARERSETPLVADALAAIERGGREAMQDMHRFLRLLGDRNGHDEAPGLADLPELVERTRGLGTEVGLAVDDGVRDVPVSISATVYRVVQEGLTNAVKHSAASRVDVDVRREGASLVVTVEDDGTRERHPTMPTGGHGLAGLRERVDLFGGCLTAGAGPSGWRLKATIPLAARGEP